MSVCNIRHDIALQSCSCQPSIWADRVLKAEINPCDRLGWGHCWSKVENTSLSAFSITILYGIIRWLRVYIYLTHLNDQMLVTLSPRSPSSPIVPIIGNQSVRVTMPSVAAPRNRDRGNHCRGSCHPRTFPGGELGGTFNTIILLVQVARRLPPFAFRGKCPPPSRCNSPAPALISVDWWLARDENAKEGIS